MDHVRTRPVIALGGRPQTWAVVPRISGMRTKGMRSGPRTTPRFQATKRGAIRLTSRAAGPGSGRRRSRARRQAGHGGHQLTRLDRLGEIFVEAGREDALALLEPRMRGERDDGELAAPVRGQAAQLEDEAVAVLARHRDV